MRREANQEKKLSTWTGKHKLVSKKTLNCKTVEFVFHVGPIPLNRSHTGFEQKFSIWRNLRKMFAACVGCFAV